MGRVTQENNPDDCDDEINRPRSRHEAERLDHESPHGEDAETNREILAQLRVSMQHVARRLTQGVPDTVGLHIASEKRSSSRESGRSPRTDRPVPRRTVARPRSDRRPDEAGRVAGISRLGPSMLLELN